MIFLHENLGQELTRQQSWYNAKQPIKINIRYTLHHYYANPCLTPNFNINGVILHSIVYILVKHWQFVQIDISAFCFSLGKYTSSMVCGSHMLKISGAKFVTLSRLRNSFLILGILCFGGNRMPDRMLSYFILLAHLITFSQVCFPTVTQLLSSIQESLSIFNL